MRLVRISDTDDRWQMTDGLDEGEDVGGDDDGASSEQVVGCPIVAILSESMAKHHPAKDQLEQSLAQSLFYAVVFHFLLHFLTSLF